jgi:hypothetical protein
MTNSVKEFFQTLFVSGKLEDLEDQAASIRYPEIKQKYERFCFLKHYPELNMLSDDASKYLNEKGYKFEKKVDNSTEVFQKIRLLNDRELSKAKNEFIDPDISSLEAFIHSTCVLTQFDQDTVNVAEFKAK